MAPARACAYVVLRRVFEQGAYADLALRAQAQGLDARDRALAMRLAYGAVQRRGTLDHLIERLAGRPVKRLDAPLLAALRLGLHELLFLGGAPDHAVVADAVQLAKTGGGVREASGRGPQEADGRGAREKGGREPQRASDRGPRGAAGPGRGGRGGGHGLVNAVLRRATREGVGLLEELEDGTPEGAALKHSHPRWIARLWWDALGAEHARALLAFDNEPGELALRVNTLVADPAALVAQLPAGLRSGAVHGDLRVPEALVADGPWDVHGSEMWRTGAVLAQSRAAMLPARALGPKAGERVLDLCAAPGGKSTHLAALMGGRGEVVAVERNPRRAAEMQQTVERLHAQECVRVVVGDAARPLTGEEPFDRVLVDPPCSGLGTLQARADLRWRVTPEDVRQLAGVQAGILAAGAAAVRPGGVLIYSTCTISPTENELQISAFLESNPDFALDDLGAELPALRRGRCVLTLPHRDRTAGFFIARLRRG